LKKVEIDSRTVSKNWSLEEVSKAQLISDVSGAPRYSSRVFQEIETPFAQSRDSSILERRHPSRRDTDSEVTENADTTADLISQLQMKESRSDAEIDIMFLDAGWKG